MRALERSLIVREIAIDERDSLGVSINQLSWLGEVEAEHLVLLDEPPGAQTELEPPAGKVIDRNRLLGEQSPDCPNSKTS